MSKVRHKHPGALSRDLGLLHAIGIGLGAVMGAGIFVVTGVAAGAAGPAFLIGLAVAGCAATFNGLSSAQLAARYPQSGGTYEYGYELLNPSAGFAAGWMFLASKLAACLPALSDRDWWPGPAGGWIPPALVYPLGA